MHFLSHYYSELPANDPLFVTGLIIPDLTKGFSKTYNSVIRKATVSEDESIYPIHNGVLQHFEADKKFHNSSLFMQQVSNVLQSFIQSGLGREKLRLSVIAHLTVEMLLDRQILLNDEKICVEFYSTIARVDESVLRTYLRLLTTETQERIFLTNFLLFRQKQFLFLFKNAENIVFALNRIYGSTTGISFTENEKLKFLTAINNIDSEIRYSWKEILKR
jgi:hypothetical protein